MTLEKYQLEAHNDSLLTEHQRKIEFISHGISNYKEIIEKLIQFQIAIPSWALGTGGTRFGRFGGAGEPRGRGVGA